MSDEDLRLLERDAEHDPLARRRLWNARARLGDLAGPRQALRDMIATRDLSLPDTDPKVRRSWLSGRCSLVANLLRNVLLSLQERAEQVGSLDGHLNKRRPHVFATVPCGHLVLGYYEEQPEPAQAVAWRFPGERKPNLRRCTLVLVAATQRGDAVTIGVAPSRLDGSAEPSPGRAWEELKPWRPARHNPCGKTWANLRRWADREAPDRIRFDLPVAKQLPRECANCNGVGHRPSCSRVYPDCRFGCCHTCSGRGVTL